MAFKKSGTRDDSPQFVNAREELERREAELLKEAREAESKKEEKAPEGDEDASDEDSDK